MKSVTKWLLYGTVTFLFFLSSQKHIALSSPHPWHWRHLWHHIVLEGHLPWEVSGLGYVYFLIWALRMGRDWTCVAEKCASGAALTSSTHEPDTRAGNNCTLYLLPEFTTSVMCCSSKWPGMGTWVGKANRYKVFLYGHFFFTSTGALNPGTHICQVNVLPLSHLPPSLIFYCFILMQGLTRFSKLVLNL